jgi:hypothetical protein
MTNNGSLNGRRRVVITGLGAVTPLGGDVESTWDGLVAGRSGAGEITQFDSTDYAVHFACEVKDFDPSQWIDRKQARRMDRFAQLILAAARQAVRAEARTLEQQYPEANRNVDVVLVPEIERGFDTRGRDQNRFAPFAHAGRQGATGPCHSLASLQLRFGIKKIGKTFGLGQIDPAVGKSPAGELTRRGPSQSGKLSQAVLHRRDYRATAVKMKFGQVLSGRSSRSGEPEHQRSIEFRVFGVSQGP